MTNPQPNLLEQLEAIEKTLANLVTQEDIDTMEKALTIIPQMLNQIKKAERAGLNFDRLEALRERLVQTQQAVDNWLREYRT